MTTEIGRDDFVVNYNDGSLYEAIELHNKHVDKMLSLGRMLFDMLDEDDPVIDKFMDVFNSAAGIGIYLCCEANSREDEPVWSMYEDFHVDTGNDDDDMERFEWELEDEGWADK